jgi:hypothetical protein
MSPELRQAIMDRWFRPVTPQSPRTAVTQAEIEALGSDARSELSVLFAECFPVSRGTRTPSDELARFFEAVMFVEYGFDSVNLWPPDLRQERWDSVARAIGWPVDRLMSLSNWWYASSHHREFSYFV